MKKRTFAIIFSALLFLSLLSSCSSGAKSGAKVFEKISPASVSAGQKNALGFSNAKKEKLRLVSKTDMAALYFDEKTFSVCVYDSGADKLWRSLPENETSENTSVLSAVVIADGKEYTLFSQSDSVALGNADYTLGNDGVTVNYRFKKTLGKEDADFTVPVVFSAKDGMLVCSVNCKDIKVSDGNIILKSISILSWFGADRDGKSGDFILVPDGCGAIIDTSKRVEKFEDISLSVYGGDPSLEESESAEVCVPAFGKKSGDGAFVALIENGGAIAKIGASKSLKKSGFNRVFASFDLAQTMSDEKKTYVSKNGFDGLVSVSYRFLSGDNANYVAMASACRELLIRSSVLSMNERETAQSEGLPFELTLLCSAKLKGTKNSGYSPLFPRRATLSRSFVQRELKISRFGSKGFLRADWFKRIFLRQRCFLRSEQKKNLKNLWSTPRGKTSAFMPMSAFSPPPLSVRTAR